MNVDCTEQVERSHRWYHRGAEAEEAIWLEEVCLLSRSMLASPKPTIVHCNLVNHFEQWGVCLFNQEVDLCLIPVAPLQRALSLGGSPSWEPDCRWWFMRSGRHKSKACRDPWFSLAHLGTQHKPWAPSHLTVGVTEDEVKVQAQRLLGLIYSIIYSTNKYCKLSLCQVLCLVLGI